MTVPNLLTFIRILLTPVLVWLLSERRFGQALFVFFFAALTDGLDGFIARVFHRKSKLGAYLDPLADKLLLVSSFILLAYQGLIPDWLAVITVSRDIIILLGVATLMFYQIPLDIDPSILSKLTTLAQILTVLVSLASPTITFSALSYSLLYGATAILSFLSGFHYVFRGIQMWEIHGDQGKGS